MNATSTLSRRARILRWVVFLNMGAAVAVFLAYGVENLRGWSEWKSQRDALLAQGRPLRPADYFPPPVPDSENFALIPLLQPLFDFDPSPTATNRWRDPDAFGRTLRLFDLPGARRGGGERWPSEGSGRWQGGIPLDLARFQAALAERPAAPDPSELRRRYGLVPPVGATPPPSPSEPARVPAAPGPEVRPYLPPTPGTPARDILYVLNHFESDFQAIEEGLRLPHSRFPIQYGQGYSTLLPHLALLKKFGLRFRLRGVARLAEGDTDGALRDIESMLRLADSSQAEPFLISHLVRAACLHYAIHTAWEGVIRHAWTEPQLSQLQARFAGYDLLPDIRRCLQVEQAGLIELIEGLIASPAERRKYSELFASGSDGAPVSGADMAQLEWYLRLAPRGWLYASLAASIRALEALIAFDPAHPEAVPATWRVALDAEPPSLRLLMHHRFVLRKGAPERFDRSVINLVRTHTSLHIAAQAVALERHRLARGGYPARLEDLDPRFQVAPRSSTQTLRYRPEAGDRFRLWTDGDDGRNDDGAWPDPISPGGPTLGGPAQQGDWVWRWPDPETP